MKSVDWIQKNSKTLTQLSDSVWNFAELALNERKSSELLADAVRKEGFRIETNISGMETAFRAVWGEGAPRIGFLGEYDALLGLSQKAVPYKEKKEGSEIGHGCGHNLLGVGSLAAAIALRYRMESEGLPGTVVFFGCPAEETMTGKIRMNDDGLFGGFDAVLTWHPAYVNGVMEENLLAMKSLLYTFDGVASHASSAPEQGHSALDAVELMNVGVNYLREHVPEDVRIHYTITDGGGEPNIVPARAQSKYFIRATDRRIVEETVSKITSIAEGAALMTGTVCHPEQLSGCSHFLHNEAFEELLHDCMVDTPVQEWTKEEIKFARRLVDSLDPEVVRGIRKNRTDLFTETSVLHDGVTAFTKTHPRCFLSTDVSDVSWSAPTAQIWSCCAPIGVMQHTWQFTASVGTEIGHRGMLYAAQVLSEAGWRLLSNPQLLTKIQEDFLAGKGRQG